LIIRTDASTEAGTGHLMRCIALAQAWKDSGGRAIFITACQGEGLLQRLRQEGFDINTLANTSPHKDDWDVLSGVLAGHPDSWVVMDGYHFDEAYQQRIKRTGNRLLVIDDLGHLKHYNADIIVNQNLNAESIHYSCESSTRLLLGTKFALLRREFLAWRDRKSEVSEAARKILVTMGGSDPGNQTAKVVKALCNIDIPGLEVKVVAGTMNPHIDSLTAATEKCKTHINLVRYAKNMPELIAWADVAIASSGTTVWELLYLGIPSLFLVLADNQRGIAEGLQSRGLGINLGWADDVTVESISGAIKSLLKDADLRAKMSEKARKEVDGVGAARVVAAIKAGGRYGLRLRAVTEDDCRLVWQWANDPVVRAASFNPEPILWEDHQRWFKGRLSDPACYYYLAVDNEDNAVGQIRFDTAGDKAEINVSVAADFRGRGYGAECIRVASQRLFQEAAVSRIYAHIKPENQASISAFKEAGYRMTDVKIARGHDVLQMILDRFEEALNSEGH